MGQHPDMMSYAFNVHDEYLPALPALAADGDVFPAFWATMSWKRPAGPPWSTASSSTFKGFYPGAFWSLEESSGTRACSRNPVWATPLFGWQGGAWTPPAQSTSWLDHLPPDVKWNVSIMATWLPKPLAAMAIGMVATSGSAGKDNPDLPEASRHNAQLVEVIVKMAETIGLPVASTETARSIVFGHDKPAERLTTRTIDPYSSIRWPFSTTVRFRSRAGPWPGVGARLWLPRPFR